MSFLLSCTAVMVLRVSKLPLITFNELFHNSLGIVGLTLGTLLLPIVYVLLGFKAYQANFIQFGLIN